MIELTNVLAVGIALTAALSAACRNLTLRVGTEKGSVTEAILIVMIVNLVLLVPLVGVIYYPSYRITPTSLVSFILAGLFGTLLGRLLMYSSIERIGASRTGPFIASWGLFATIGGLLFLGETLSILHGIGVILIVVGVVVIAWENSSENPDDLPRRALLVSILVPLAAGLSFGLEPIFAKFGLAEGTPAAVGLVIKTVFASLGYSLYLWWHGELPSRDSLSVRKNGIFYLAGVFGTGFLLGYYAALTLGPVSIVSPAVSTTALFVVGLSVLFMPSRLERVNWRVGLAALIVVVGIGFISAFG